MIMNAYCQIAIATSNKYLSIIHFQNTFEYLMYFLFLEQVFIFYFASLP